MTGRAAIAFTPAPAEQSPNLRRTSAAGAAQTYYQAIMVTFASVRRWNPDLDLVFVTDVDPPASFESELARLEVRLLHAQFDHAAPKGFWPTFNASLYTLDAMAKLAQTAEPGDHVLLMDPDVLCTGNLAPALALVAGHRFLVYPTGFPAHEKNQGLSAFDAALLHKELDDDLIGPPVHYGGELYGFTPEAALDVLGRAEDAWKLALAKWADGQRHFVTEEHLLNYALRRAPLVDARSVVRRICTAPVYRTVRGDEAELLLWHLPSEKDRAFVRLATAAASLDSWFWMADRDTFVRRAGALTGIPRRGIVRFTYDTLACALRVLQGRSVEGC